MFKSKVNKFVPPNSEVAPLPKAHVAPIAGRVMPGEKRPEGTRWEKLQGYLEKSTRPVATPKTDGEEPV